MRFLFFILASICQIYILNAANDRKETTTSRTTNTVTETNKGGSSAETTTASSKGDGKQIHCPKTCRSTYEKIASRRCSLIGYKEKVFTDSQESCSSICEEEKVWCSHAVFVQQRKVNDNDYFALFAAVLSKSSWIKASDFDKDRRKSIPQDEHEFRNLLESDESVVTKNMRLSRKKRSDKKDVVDNLLSNGTCFLFESSSVKKLKCQKSATTSSTSFKYDLIVCKAEEECIRSARNCPCGYCGNGCKNLNYHRVPNACMAQFYFGHKVVTSVKECVNFCLETPGCKSVDYGDIETCLINYVNRTDRPLYLGCDGKNNEKFDYYELVCDSECANEKPRPPMSEDVCMNNPKICKHGGICETIELPHPQQSFTYQCNCPCNYCGKHCEKPNMKTFKNACMKHATLAWSVAKTFKECIAMCQQNVFCSSVSFSGSAHSCILHWGISDVEKIIPSSSCPKFQINAVEAEWCYFELICDKESCSDKVQVLEGKLNEGCKSSPCANNGECGDIFHDGKISGYFCNCPCGYCGDNCEQLNYDMIKNACVWGNHISNIPDEYYRESATLKQCLSLCAQSYPICKGIDLSDKGNCYLNKKSSREVKPSPRCNNYARDNWNLYELSCSCQNQPVIYGKENVTLS